MKKIRLDKFLADSGIGTRSQVKKLLKCGRVQVDGKIVKEPEYKIDLQQNQVLFDNKMLSYTEFEYLMFHKPAGCVTAREDKMCKTVLDYIDGNEVCKKDLSPVGRLDKDTEGLLVLTNDGQLTHHLLAPSHHVSKTYYVELDVPIEEEDCHRLEAGIDIGDDKLTAPAKIRQEEQDLSHLYITITEGRFHQVKRMFQAVGRSVVYLKRISMAKLMLDEHLKPGEYRRLTEEELLLLRGEAID